MINKNRKIQRISVVCWFLICICLCGFLTFPDYRQWVFALASRWFGVLEERVVQMPKWQIELLQKSVALLDIKFFAPLIRTPENWKLNCHARIQGLLSNHEQEARKSNCHAKIQTVNTHVEIRSHRPTPLTDTDPLTSPPTHQLNSRQTAWKLQKTFNMCGSLTAPLA